MPLRLVAQYSNGGNDATGRNQYIAAVTYGNLWGRDHQITYQYITTDQPKFFQAHSLDYRIPLRWRHNLQINASYFRAKPEIFDGALVQNGETITSDLRYTIPLRTGDNAAEVFANLSFKESNNNLAFYGTQVFGSKTDIFQLTTGGSMVRRDSRGGWLLAASVTASPGNINSRNTDRAFDAGRFDPSQDSARYGAHARYAFATLSAQRFLTLKPGWDYSARAVVQASQSNLLSSEELGIGGASTVRGFPEGIFSGDNGYLLSNDLYLPTWRKNLPRISKTRGPLEVRPLLFLDMAKVGVHKSFSSDRPRPALSSTGAGVRMSLGTNFSLSADYGWQLSELPYKEEKPRRAHIRATLAY
jgi:hemolysin activation/secretion protein